MGCASSSSASMAINGTEEEVVYPWSTEREPGYLPEDGVSASDEPVTGSRTTQRDPSPPQVDARATDASPKSVSAVAGSTAAEQAVVEYQARVKAKKKAEEEAIRRLRLDEFDPIRPLDSFNVTHRSLLGRCWDRRKVELYPIVHLWQYINQNYRLNVEQGGEMGSSNSLPSPASPAFQGRNFTEIMNNNIDYPLVASAPPPPPPGGTTTNNQSVTNNSMSSVHSSVAFSDSAVDRIRRSSHWFSVCIVSTEAMSSSTPILNRGGSFASVNMRHTPLTPHPQVDPIMAASPDDLMAAVEAMELVHQISMEERQELYGRYMNHMPRLSGGKPYFAFRLGPETSTSDSTRFLRKRGLSPAKGVEIVRWNRVELMRPTLQLIGRAVSRIQCAEALSDGSSPRVAEPPAGGPASIRDGTRNLHAGDVNCSFAGKPSDVELMQSLPPTSPILSPVASLPGSFPPLGSSTPGNGGGLLMQPSASISEAVFEGGAPEGKKKELFPIDSVHCHAVGFSLDDLDQEDTSRLALAVNCFSTSVDPYQCEANGCMMYPVDVDDSKPVAMEQFGEGIVTDVMYGGTMIIESDSKEGMTRLEEILASMEWNKPRALLNVVKEVREHAKRRRNGNGNGNAAGGEDTMGGESSPASRQMSPVSNRSSRYRIIRRIGGRPVRDAVELSEIRILLEEDSMPDISGGGGGGGSPAGGNVHLAYSRVATAWVCLNTMVAALRAWALHLLANPEYSQPISLYLQKYAGIATALQMTTVDLATSSTLSSLQLNPSGSPGLGPSAANPAFGDAAAGGNGNGNSVSSSGGGGGADTGAGAGAPLPSAAGEEGEEWEAGQVMTQIFATEMNLDPYLGEDSSSHHHQNKNTNKLFSPRGASWMPQQAPNSFFEILGNIASSSDDDDGGDSSHTSTPSSDRSLSMAGQTVADIHLLARGRASRGPNKRSAARALLRGAVTPAFHANRSSHYHPHLEYTPAPTPSLRTAGQPANPSFTIPPSSTAVATKPTTTPGEEGAWHMAMLELKALQKELDELILTHDALRATHEESVYALDTVARAFLPSMQARSLLPVLLNLRVAVRFPNELHADVLQLSQRDWFPQLVAVWSSPRCSVRRVRITTPITAKDLPKLGMVAGLLQMGFAGRFLKALEFADTTQIFSQGVTHSSSTLGSGRFTLTGSPSASNHGLPANSPPYVITAEQARDTLWILLAAVAENQDPTHFHLILKGFPRSHRDGGSFHSIGGVFRSSTYKKLPLSRRFHCPPGGSTSHLGSAGPSFAGSVQRGGRGGEEGKKAKGGCCGGGGSDSDSDWGGGNAAAQRRHTQQEQQQLSGTQSGTGSVWGSFRGNLHQYSASGTHHRHDVVIASAKERAARTAAPLQPGAGPRKDVYPFFSILCHQCRCDPDKKEEISLSFSNTAAKKPYQHIFNKTHNHEMYAMFTRDEQQQQQMVGHHHIPPLPYFPPPSGPASMNASTVRSPVYQGNANNTQARPPAGARGKKAPVAPHWHFGLSSYEEEEAEMKREEQALYTEAKDICHTLEEAVKLYNRSEKPYHITLSLV